MRSFPTSRRRRLPLLRLAAATASGLAIAGGVVGALLSRRYLRVAVAGESMTPALQPDDFLVLRRGAPPPGEAYGQVVAVHDPRPEGDGRLLLKRVIGLPGEALRVGGGVQVNGRVLDEPYAHGSTPQEQHRGINRLAEDEFFVMGDNRGASTDSRDFGPVRADDIIGTAVLRYWPRARATRIRAVPRRFLGVSEPAGPTTHPLPWVERTASG